MISNNSIILVVENELTVCLYVKDLLDDHGYVSFTATSAEEAIRILNVSDDIDLLVTDIDLGTNFTGVDLAKTARKMFPNLPVVYVTGSCSAAKTKQVENSQFLPKPYTDNALLDIIALALKTN